MPRMLIWSVADIVSMAKEMTNDINKFDLVLIIDGKRGLGKSTLGAKIMYQLKFRPGRDIVYTRDDVIRAFSKKIQGKIFADEMINVSYGRDFFQTDQKTLIKIINMYRDSRNIFIGCVPFFSNLDLQLRNLVKIRITVVEKGLAILHKPVASIYTNDPWDIKNNQRIEESWTRSGQRTKRKPRYTKLSTFAGFVKFSDLTPRQREEIEQIKTEKRNKVIALEQGGFEEEDTFDRLYNQLLEGHVTKEFLISYSHISGIDYERLRIMINRRLKKSPLTSDKTVRDFLKESVVVEKKPQRLFRI